MKNLFIFDNRLTKFYNQVVFNKIIKKQMFIFLVL
jgi:hypothetical protein